MHDAEGDNEPGDLGRRRGECRAPISAAGEIAECAQKNNAGSTIPIRRQNTAGKSVLFDGGAYDGV